MRDALLMGLAFFMGILAGDQKTIIDCAQKGEARMFGGGAVKCEVIKREG